MFSSFNSETMEGVCKMSRIFNDQKRSLSHTSRLIPLGTVFLVLLVIVSTCVALTRFSTGKAVHAADSSFIFTTAGDYNQTKHTTANLKNIAQSGASFNLALGDLSYSS